MDYKIIFQLEDGEYYRINGTKKVLYWDGNKFMKPIKDRMKRYGTYVAELEKQPKNIHTIEQVKIKDLT